MILKETHFGIVEDKDKDDDYDLIMDEEKEEQEDWYQR